MNALFAAAADVQYFCAARGWQRPGTFKEMRYTAPFDILGPPAISIPCGFSDDGVPIALQLVGKAFDEATVLRIAQAYEQETEWHTHCPPI